MCTHTCPQGVGYEVLWGYRGLTLTHGHVYVQHNLPQTHILLSDKNKHNTTLIYNCIIGFGLTVQ